MKKHLILALALGLSSLAQADWTKDFQVSSPKPEVTAAPTQAPTAVATPAPKPVVMPETVVTATPLSYAINGYVDVNAMLDTTNTKNTANGLHLGTAQLSLKADTAHGGAFLQFIGGDNAPVFTSTSGSATANIKQAYLHQDWGKFSVQAGKFIGLLGYELPDANVNLNYSRSPIFYMEPVYHLGVLAKYAVSDTTNLMAYGTSENSNDTSFDGETRDFGASLQSLGATTGFAFNWYRDNKKTGLEYGSVDSINVYAYHVLGTYTTLAAEYLNVATTNAVAAYLNVGTDPFSVAARVGVSRNPFFVLGFPAPPADTINQYTLTFKSKRGNINNYLEVVTNHCANDIYMNTDGLFQNTQTTVVLGSVYGF